MAEAEALAWGGVPDILVSNQVVGAAKLARLAALARIARVAVCADDPAQVARDRRGGRGGRRRASPVLVEIDRRRGPLRRRGRAGRGGAGASASPPRRTCASAGLQAYHGRAQHLRRPEERAAADRRRRATHRAAPSSSFASRGLDCPIVGGAGTGTFALEAASGVYTEVQAGSYVLHGCRLRAQPRRRRQPVGTFRHALFVLATVISAARPGVAVLDVGHKAVAPTAARRSSGSARTALHRRSPTSTPSCEFGAETAAPKIGEKLRLIPGHCDPTVDRYDWYVGVRGGRVECLWPIAARGAMA